MLIILSAPQWCTQIMQCEGLNTCFSPPYSGVEKRSSKLWLGKKLQRYIAIFAPPFFPLSLFTLLHYGPPTSSLLLHPLQFVVCGL